MKRVTNADVMAALAQLSSPKPVGAAATAAPSLPFTLGAQVAPMPSARSFRVIDKRVSAANGHSYFVVEASANGKKGAHITLWADMVLAIKSGALTF